jgi:hypothetical protein
MLAFCARFWNVPFTIRVLDKAKIPAGALFGAIRLIRLIFVELGAGEE